MAVLKRKVSSKAKGFTPYAGDEPPRGVYRARVVKGSIRASKEKETLSYNILVEFEATKSEHKKFDGYTTFAEIWLGEHEALQAREGAFIKAVTGKDDFENVNVAYTGKEADFKSPSGAPITAIDGKKIEGKFVNVDWRWEAGNDGYEGRMRANSLFPWDKTEGAEEDEVEEEDFEEEDFEEAEDAEDEDADGEEEADEEESDEDLEAEIEERRKELKSRKYDIAKLRAAAKEAGADTKGMKKDDLVEAILDYEFGDAEDEDEDADSEEEEDGITEDDIETDDDEDDEEEDDEEEEDEDESEDLEEVLRGTAADLDRAGLKKAIKEKDADFVAKKSQSDDDLREILVQRWLTDPPF